VITVDDDELIKALIAIRDMRPAWLASRSVHQDATGKDWITFPKPFDRDCM